MDHVSRLMIHGYLGKNYTVDADKEFLNLIVIIVVICEEFANYQIS